MADVHFMASVKYRQKYNDILNKTIESIQENLKGLSHEEARIVIVGDLTNDKSHVSNTLMEDTFTFLNRLGEIAPVRVIGGNHDFNVNNTTDIDTVSLITRFMRPKDTQFLDMESDYKSSCIIDDNIVWCLYSTFDNYRRPDIDLCRIDHPDKCFVSLFHETITGAESDAGVMTNGHTLDIFKGSDIVCLGHIHKRQDFTYDGFTAAYAGSTIQQTYGESISGHGYLIWDVETKKYEPIDIVSDYGFYKFELTSLEDLDEDKERLINS